MVKKKFSGQTVAIIILAILLIVSIGFGGVYAFYSAKSNKISGTIVMANLKISLETGISDKSEIVISNGVNVVPGQPLENSPLIIKNESSAPIYLVVVYEINATKKDESKVVDKFEMPVLGLGVEYINSKDRTKDDAIGVSNTDWIDYVFKGVEENKLYRCLVSTKYYNAIKEDEDPEDITVIAKDKLSLASEMGNEYMQTSISFTFQAYAIGSQTDFGFNPNDKADKCEKIVRAIYEAHGEKFLNIKVNQ